MAKKKRAAKTPTKSRDFTGLNIESLFGEGMKQECIVLSAEERESLAVIREARSLSDSANALRHAVLSEAELAKAGKSAKPQKKSTIKTGVVGAPLQTEGGYKHMFPFRSTPATREAVEVIKAKHGIIKSVAVRHAINQEAARCLAAAGKRRK